MVGHKLCVLLITAVANELLRCGYCDGEAEFLFYFILINLNSHIDVVDTEMDASAQDQRRRPRRESPFDSQQRGEKEQSPSWERKEIKGSSVL